MSDSAAAYRAFKLRPGKQLVRPQKSYRQKLMHLFEPGKKLHKQALIHPHRQSGAKLF